MRDAKAKASKPDVEAAALIATAKEEAKVIKADAVEGVKQVVTDAEKTLKVLRADAELDATAHEDFMFCAEQEKEAIEEILIPLREELAAIKSKFSD